MVKVPVRDCWSKLTVPPEPVTLQLVHAQVSVKVNGTTTGASLQNAFDPVTGWPLGAPNTMLPEVCGTSKVAEHWETFPLLSVAVQ